MPELGKKVTLAREARVSKLFRFGGESGRVGPALQGGAGREMEVH